MRLLGAATSTWLKRGSAKSSSDPEVWAAWLPPPPRLKAAPPRLKPPPPLRFWAGSTSVEPGPTCSRE